jgi:hypothetical protein
MVIVAISAYMSSRLFQQSLIAVGLTSQNGAGVFFAIAALLTWAWVTAMAAQLMRDLNGRNG